LLEPKVLIELHALFHQILLRISDNSGRDGRTFVVYGIIKYAHRPVVIKSERTKPPDRPGGIKLKKSLIYRVGLYELD
jgi:hypothetical protein